MKSQKIIALLTVMLVVLLIVPIISNNTGSNQMTPILLPQGNTQPKAITTEPLGNYITSGDNLTYNGLIYMAEALTGEGDGGEISLTFEFNYGSWGNWFMVNATVDDDYSVYFAIHNQTREVGLNSTGGLFYTRPADESSIYRQDNVYAFLALPTGIAADDHVKILTPYIIELDLFPEVLTSKVLGRATAPVYGEQASFYDTWMSHGTWKGTITTWGDVFQCAMGLNDWVEDGSGLCVGSFIAESLACVTVGDEDFWSEHLMLQFNSSLSTPNIMEPLADVNITDYDTTESMISTWSTDFTYSETGYWSMNLGGIPNSTLGTVRLDSLSNSYFNWTLGPSSGDFLPLEYGVSQEVRIPTDLWNFVESQGGTWNPTYYDGTTHTGWRDNYMNGTAGDAGIVNLLRFFNSSGVVYPISMFCLAPAWIREGTVMYLLVPIPLFWPNNTIPSLNFDPTKANETMFTILPYKVSGAVTVNIGGYGYDCWKAELILPTGLSNLNVTQLDYTLYFERSTGILMKAKADIEMTTQADFGGSTYYVPFTYHKTWAMSDINGGGLFPPVDFFEVASIYYLDNIDPYTQPTLDSSFFNGGSVTAECNDTADLSVFAYTLDLNNYTNIGGYPLVKLLHADLTVGSSPYEVNATVSFCYTPSELLAKGAKESAFTICAWNSTTSTWEPLNTTVDYNGRVVSANTTHLSVFALVAGPLTIWDILGPSGTAALLYLLTPQSNLIPILGGIAVALIAVIAVAIIILARRH